MPNETLVMLPGMMCDERLFAPQIAAFENDYTIIVPKMAGASSISELATQILREVAVPHFNLLGLSMGGIVAMAMTGQAQERITRLALLNTTYKADSPGNFTPRNRQIADVKAGRLRRVITEELKPNYLARCNQNNKFLRDLLITMALDLGEEAFITQTLALLNRPDQSEILKSYEGPTLVLCGKEDHLCLPERHTEMAALLPNATLRITDNAGHISTLEQANAVNAAVAHWLVKPI
jgi:pimeloyl-ACP methyl ester carboxylesterase